MLPFTKKPKLGLAAAAASKHGGHRAQGPHNTRATAVSALGAETSDVESLKEEDEFSQEEEDEQLQIQSSLPLYLDHLFGLFIGQGCSSTQSATGMLDSGAAPRTSITETPQTHTDYNTPHISTPPLHQCAAPMLDSQGFLSTAHSVNTILTIRSSPSTQTQPLFSLSSLPNIIPDSLYIESCTTVADSLYVESCTTVSDSLLPQTRVSPIGSGTVRQESPVLFHSPEPSHIKQTPVSKAETCITHSDVCKVESGPPPCFSGDFQTHNQTTATEGGKIQTSVVKGGKNQTTAIEGGKFQTSIVKGGENQTSVVGGGKNQTSVVKGGENQTSVVKGGENQTSVVEGGKNQTSVVKGGENQTSVVKGGKNQTTAIEGGKFQTSVVKGGENQTSVVGGGKNQTSVVKGGENQTSVVEGGKNQTSVVKGGENQTSVVEGGENQSSVVEGGVACGQKVASNTPKVTSKKRKRSLGHLSVGEKYVCPPGTTPLKDCTELHTSVSLFAFVLLVNPVMDVACKAGTMAGRTVPMSSLLLGDPTKSYFKLSLWRQAATWSERIAVGDIVYFKRIRLKMWKKEIVGTTTMYSSVLNLHQPKKPLPPQVAMEIPYHCLESLVHWGKQYHAYLFEGYSLIPKSQRSVVFVSSIELSSHSVVHFRAKLLSVVTDKVLIIADHPGREVYLYLVSGDTSLWSSQLKSGCGCVWEFTYLSVASDTATQGGCYSFQTTSRSQLRAIDDSCEMAIEILKRFPTTEVSALGIRKGCSIAQVLTGRASGAYQLTAKALTIQTITLDGSRLDMQVVCSLEPTQVVEQLCQHCLYVGCESCSKLLSQDENGIYCQCISCLLTKPKSNASFLYYFRPMAITLEDNSGHVTVVVTHTVVPKVMGIKPLEIVQTSLVQANSKCADLKEALSARLSLLMGEGVWTVSLALATDENSFLESLAMSLLDWSCDNHMS